MNEDKNYKARKIEQLLLVADDYLCDIEEAAFKVTNGKNIVEINEALLSLDYQVNRVIERLQTVVHCAIDEAVGIYDEHNEVGKKQITNIDNENNSSFS